MLGEADKSIKALPPHIILDTAWRSRGSSSSRRLNSASPEIHSQMIMPISSGRLLKAPLLQVQIVVIFVYACMCHTVYVRV